MKKYISVFLIPVLILCLAACGGGNTSGESTVPGKSEVEPDRQTAEGTENEAQEIQDIPFGQYHTEEELLTMLENGDFSTYISVDPEMPAESIDTGGDEPYSGFSNSIIFTDGGSAEGVEYPDFTEQLSPEQQAEWEELEQAMSDPEVLDMFGETEDFE